MNKDSEENTDNLWISYHEPIWWMELGPCTRLIAEAVLYWSTQNMMAGAQNVSEYDSRRAERERMINGAQDGREYDV